MIPSYESGTVKVELDIVYDKDEYLRMIEKYVKLLFFKYLNFTYFEVF